MACLLHQDAQSSQAKRNQTVQIDPLVCFGLILLVCGWLMLPLKNHSSHLWDLVGIA